MAALIARQQRRPIQPAWAPPADKRPPFERTAEYERLFEKLQVALERHRTAQELWDRLREELWARASASASAMTAMEEARARYGAEPLAERPATRLRNRLLREIRAEGGFADDLPGEYARAMGPRATVRRVPNSNQKA